MGSQNGKRQNTQTSTSVSRGRGVIGVLAVCLVLLGVTAYVLKRNEGQADRVPAPKASTPAADASSSSTAANKDPAFLKGRWLRPDGGYVIEIRQVDRNGQLDAAYFNPQPIHISRAEVTKDGAATKVFIVLEDANYPGCKYNLTYIPDGDRLAGTYFQAALGETFDVFFERMK